MTASFGRGRSFLFAFGNYDKCDDLNHYTGKFKEILERDVHRASPPFRGQELTAYRMW